MPNWCENKLTVSGPKQDVERFCKENRGRKRGQTLSFERLLPTPKAMVGKGHAPGRGEARLRRELAELAGRKPATFWFTWRCQNWGTKWDVEASACTKKLEAYDRYEYLRMRATYRFDTAWSPPVHWMHRASKRYPMLSFVLRFNEPGMCIRGQVACKDGKEAS